MQTDYIWDELSKVYNMSDVPDKAKSIIGDLMLKLDESSAQPDHLAEVSKKGDLISREDALSCFHDWIDQRGDVHTADEMPEYQRIEQLPTAQPDNQINLCDSCDYSYPDCPSQNDYVIFGNGVGNDNICACNKYKPSAQPEESKYEYHYDHTDCIWYRPEARNRCPTTCAQYRDGWNDAMNYIFRDGKGYRHYRRDKQYEE